MKAIVCTKYGSPDGLQLKEVEKPTPKENEVLIRIYATTVTFGDTMLRSFKFPLKLVFGLFFDLRKNKILGHELAGEIEAVGVDVKRFRKGDQVFASTGMASGAYAEYSCWLQDELTPVSNDLDPTQLICLTLNYITAYILITRVGKLIAGQHVLVHGAGGGVGTAMLDLCRMMGIKAFGTASLGKHELVESLNGIPIDYKNEDFVEVVNHEGGIDLVVDHIGGNHLVRSFNCLRPEGTLVSTSSYAAALGQSGMVETVSGLIRLQMWNLWPNRRSTLLFDITTFYKKTLGCMAKTYRS